MTGTRIYVGIGIDGDEKIKFLHIAETLGLRKGTALGLIFRAGIEEVFNKAEKIKPMKKQDDVLND